MTLRPDLDTAISVPIALKPIVARNTPLRRQITCANSHQREMREREAARIAYLHVGVIDYSVEGSAPPGPRHVHSAYSGRHLAAVAAYGSGTAGEFGRPLFGTRRSEPATAGQRAVIGPTILKSEKHISLERARAGNRRIPMTQFLVYCHRVATGISRQWLNH